MKFIYTLLIIFSIISISITAQPTVIYEDFKGEASNRTASYNGKLYFSQKNSDEVYSFEMWESDGTPNGTKLFSDRLGEGSHFPVFGLPNVLLFRSYLSNQSTIMSYNATTESTMPLIPNVTDTELLIPFGNNKMVIVAHQNNIRGIWITDGTITGTFKLQITSNGLSVYEEDYKVVGNELYFKVYSLGLFKTDGLSSTVKTVKLFNEDTFNNVHLGKSTLYNNELYFVSCENTYNCGIWKTNGTTAGTQFVIDVDTNRTRIPFINFIEDKVILASQSLIRVIDTSFAISTLSELANLYYLNSQNEVTGQVLQRHELNEKILYLTRTDKYGTELWTTDGTIQGTKVLKDIWKRAASALNRWRVAFTECNGYLYFLANDGIHGEELWRTDGTDEGTTLIMNITRGAIPSYISHITAVGENLFFITNNEQENTKLWALNTNNHQPPTYTTNQRGTEWWQAMGTQYDTYNLDVKLDKDDNIFMAGRYDANNYFEFYEQDLRLKNNELISYNRLFVAKFNKGGTLQWAKNVGDYGWILNNAIDVDKEGNLLVAGYFNDQAAFDSTKIEGDNGMFLAKFSSNGDLTWVRQGVFSAFSYVKGIDTDNDGNIYVTGNYNDFEASWGPFNLSYFVSPAVFVVKYDKDGVVQWAKNLDNELLIYRDVTDIEIDNYGDILILVSKGSVNTWSSCEYSAGYTELFCLNPSSGTTKWLKRFESTDLHVSRSIAVTPNDDILLAGQYRGTFHFDDFTIESEEGEHCHLTTGFAATLDRFGNARGVFDDGAKDSKFHQILSMDNQTFGIIGGIEYDETEQYYDNWNLGDSKLFFRQYDYLGNLIAEREWFQHVGDDFQKFNPRAQIDSENHLILSNTYVGYVDTFPNFPIHDYSYPQAYLMRTALDRNLQTFTPDYSDNNIIIAPNPTNGLVTIKVENEEWLTYQLNIYAADGRVIYTESKDNNSSIHSLDIRHLASGSLMFQFINGTKELTKKVIKF